MDITTLQDRATALKAEIAAYAQEAQNRINSEREDIQTRQNNLQKTVRDSQRQIDSMEGRLAEVEGLINVASQQPSVPDGKNGLAGEVKDAELVSSPAA